MLMHPTKQELLSHAEALIAGRAISSGIARHVAKCSSCAAEAQAMRRSLGFVHSADELEPSSDMTARILSAARAERAVLRTERRSRKGVAVMLAKGLSFAAALAVISALSFSVALKANAKSASAMRMNPARTTASRATAPAAGAVEEKAAEEIRLLATAVASRGVQPSDAEEWRHARAVVALNSDLTAVRAVLKRYPGCERANRLMSSNLQRQAQALKSLYVEQTY